LAKDRSEIAFVIPIRRFGAVITAVGGSDGDVQILRVTISSVAPPPTALDGTSSYKEDGNTTLRKENRLRIPRGLHLRQYEPRGKVWRRLKTRRYAACSQAWGCRRSVFFAPLVFLFGLLVAAHREGVAVGPPRSGVGRSPLAAFGVRGAKSWCRI
jgi:hypothetical protein